MLFNVYKRGSAANADLSADLEQTRIKNADRISVGIRVVDLRSDPRNGVAALMTVVIVAAATLIIAMNASLLGLGDLDEGYTSQRGAEALSVADGCIEETLRRIRLDTDYGVGAGTISLTVSNGSCSINVTDLGGNQRQVTVTGTSGDYHKKLETTITLSGTVITIDSWEEKDD